MPDLYHRAVRPGDPDIHPAIEIVDTDVDLYWAIALEMYRRIAEANGASRTSVFIVPVGPTFQYRRFVTLCRRMAIDLSATHFFFMDEYLAPAPADPQRPSLIDMDHPLSFRGFVRRELAEPLAALGASVAFSMEQVHFPDPADPSAYDRRIADLGGVDVCFAGVGINGHMAFNEPPYPPDSEAALAEAADFFERGTRVVDLSRETITINSNTALGGAWEIIPTRAVTVGMRQIRESRALRVYLNRPWQRAVVRKMLFRPVTAAFPASIVQDHPDVRVTMTRDVAEVPEFALR